MREQKGWLKLCAISCVYVSVSEYVYLCDGVCLRLFFVYALVLVCVCEYGCLCNHEYVLVCCVFMCSFARVCMCGEGLYELSCVWVLARGRVCVCVRVDVFVIFFRVCMLCGVCVRVCVIVRSSMHVIRV